MDDAYAFAVISLSLIFCQLAKFHYISFDFLARTEKRKEKYKFLSAYASICWLRPRWPNGQSLRDQSLIALAYHQQMSEAH
jgi:hypothetical protein